MLTKFHPEYQETKRRFEERFESMSDAQKAAYDETMRDVAKLLRRTTLKLAVVMLFDARDARRAPPSLWQRVKARLGRRI